MSPLPDLDNGFDHILSPRANATVARVDKPTDPAALTLEAWAEGFMVGSLIIMSCITLANMRRGVLLHKLILLELVMGYWQGAHTSCCLLTMLTNPQVSSSSSTLPSTAGGCPWQPYS